MQCAGAADDCAEHMCIDNTCLNITDVYSPEEIPPTQVQLYSALDVAERSILWLGLFSFS